MSKHLKNLVAATVLCAAFAIPALAEGNGFNEGFVSLFLKDGGVMQKVVSDPKMMAELMKGGTEIAPGSMIVTHNGKTYLVHDAKMADGRMMSELFMAYGR